MTSLVRRRLLAAASRHPNDGKFCYAIGTSGKLFYSVNYGQTFAETGLTPGVTARLAVDDTGKATCITAGGVMMTATPNATGTAVTTNASVRTGMGAAQSLCVSTGSYYAHYAVNSGTSWSTGYTAQIKRSVNAAAPTNQTALSTWDQAAMSASACSSDGKYALIGGLGGYTNAFYTNNFGVSWTECLATQSFGNETRDVAVSGTGRTALTTTSTGWNRSYDYLATWAQGNAATTWWGVDISGADYNSGEGVAFLTNSNKGLWRGTISGTGAITWTKIHESANVCFPRTNFYGTRLIGLGFGREMYYSSNGGYTWATSNLSGFVALAMNKSPK